MNHASLFTGIAGFDLSAEWMGWENIFQVENNEFCIKVNTKNFPNVKKYKDIFEFDGTKYRGQIDVLTGGFPCQPFSHAGKRKGESDSRFLWPEMLRVITEIEPTFVVCENVTGLLSLEDGKTFEKILSSLEDQGYTVESFIIPACSVGAWHRRDRIWIICYPKHYGSFRLQEQINGRNENGPPKNFKQFERSGETFTNNTKQGSQRHEKQQNKQTKKKQQSRRFFRGDSWWKSEPDMDRVANGIPNRVDRLKALGNAIVPHVVYEIFKCIDNIYDPTQTISN